MIIDKARSLAGELAKSEEYLEYKRCRDEVHADEGARAFVSEYSRLKRTAQQEIATGQSVDDLTAHKLEHLTQWLQMNKSTADFLLAEYRLNRLVGDIYRVIAEAVDIRMDFLEE